MGRKVIFKVGDRVLHRENTDIAGCLVYKAKEGSSQFQTGKIWSVHWSNPTPAMQKRGGRGIYSESELIKDSPTISKKDEVDD